MVDASGPSMAVISQLGVRLARLSIIGLQVYFYMEESVGETFFFYDRYGRFDHVGWIVPKGDKLLVGIASTSIAGVPDRDVLDNALCSVLKNYGYSCRLKPIGARYTYGRVPVGLESFVFDVVLPGGVVLAVGEAGGFITPRNGEGIPYALWTGTYAAMHVDDPGGYRRVVCREIVERELLPKIREAREFYKGIHGVDPLEYVSSQADSVRVGGCSG